MPGTSSGLPPALQDVKIANKFLMPLLAWNGGHKCACLLPCKAQEGDDMTTTCLHCLHRFFPSTSLSFYPEVEDKSFVHNKTLHARTRRGSLLVQA
jgi:hypothetical protein